MSERVLRELGEKVANLRIARQMKQTELAYEAGVSHRTLQRLEAGDPVKSDGLLRVIRCLGRLDDVMDALDADSLSPFEQLSGAGLELSQLGEQSATARKRKGRRRVRRSRGDAVGSAPEGASVQWPEDRE